MVERQAARNAGEPQAASPHSEPKNGNVEHEPEKQHCMGPKPEQQNSMEQGPELGCGMEQRPQHYGAEQEDTKHELERLHKALCESEAECSSLREKLSALQKEFSSEEPTPPSSQTQVDSSSVVGHYVCTHVHACSIVKWVSQISFIL